MTHESRWTAAYVCEHSTIVTSSRDGAPVPKVRSARQLVKAAEAAGWRASQQYALATVDDTELASVAVRLDRGDEWAWALWWNEDGAGWTFEGAFRGLTRHGYRALISELTEGTT